MTRYCTVILIVLSIIFVTGCQQSPEGQQYPDDAWAHCIEHDGEVEVREIWTDNFSKLVFTMCIFPDGSECGKWMYYFDECKPGDSLVTEEIDFESLNMFAAYCIKAGYSLATSLDDLALEVCLMPDGTECRIYDFLAGYCGKEFSYCAQQGGRIIPGWSVATCVLPGGISCNENDFVNGECGAEE